MTDDIKTVDLRLAVYIAIHTPIKAVDHLGELLKILGR